MRIMLIATHTHTDETDVQEFSCLSVTSPQNQYYSILSTKNKSFTYAEQTSSDFETDKSPNSDINKSDLDTNESDSSINEPDPNSNEFGTSPNEESVTSISESPAVSTNEEISATGSELNESNTIDENANISVGATGISGVEEYEKTFVEGGNKYKVKVTLKASSQSTNDDQVIVQYFYINPDTNKEINLQQLVYSKNAWKQTELDSEVVIRIHNEIYEKYSELAKNGYLEGQTCFVDTYTTIDENGYYPPLRNTRRVISAKYEGAKIDYTPIADGLKDTLIDPFLYLDASKGKTLADMAELLVSVFRNGISVQKQVGSKAVISVTVQNTLSVVDRYHVKAGFASKIGTSTYNVIEKYFASESGGVKFTAHAIELKSEMSTAAKNWFNGKHTHSYKASCAMRCSSCGYGFTQYKSGHNFILVPEEAGSGNHIYQCSKCESLLPGDWAVIGTGANGGSCSYSGNYVVSGSNGHHRKCTGCGDKGPLKSHKMIYRQTSSGHIYECSECKWQSSSAPHSFTYIQNGTNGHFRKCSICGYTTSNASHNLAYFKTASKHTYKCSTCGWVSSSNSHTFSSKTCIFCSYKKS